MRVVIPPRGDSGLRDCLLSSRRRGHPSAGLLAPFCRFFPMPRNRENGSTMRSDALVSLPTSAFGPIPDRKRPSTTPSPRAL